MKMIYLFFILMLLISCSDDNNITGFNAKVISFESFHFPLKVGCWWRYQVIDSSLAYPITDTTILRIASVSDSVLIKNYKCYWLKNDTIIDSAVFISKDGTISYKSLSLWGKQYLGDFTLKFPFKKGDTWTSDWYSNTTYWVNSSDDTTFILGNYYNSFQIRMEIYNNVHDGTYMTMNIANDVGIIFQKVYTHLMFDALNHREFKLLDYELK